MMIDGHIHIHKNPLTKETVYQYIKTAISRNIDTLQILEHTHKFKEFRQMYEPMLFLPEQKEWLENDFGYSIQEYLDLIKEIRKENLPIKVLFGLEVCYQTSEEHIIKELLKNYDFDFLVGSVHFINHIAYDSSWSKKELWEKYTIDDIYKTYYEEIFNLIESDIFTQLGHPDTIKMFNYYPSFDLTNTYVEMAKLLNKHNMKVEDNVGCHYRYNHKDIGLSDELLQILKDNHCNIITASDAHNPKDVGTNIIDAYHKIKE